MNSWLTGSGEWLIDDIYISSGVNTTMIPEPSTFGIVLTAMAGLAIRCRRIS